MTCAKVVAFSVTPSLCVYVRCITAKGQSKTSSTRKCCVNSRRKVKYNRISDSLHKMVKECLFGPQIFLNPSIVFYLQSWTLKFGKFVSLDRRRSLITTGEN